ncbi:hypothetical protein chiPu_0013633 [Chiloscyllium punctatum]|uniref:glucuronosyltransferase n=1 Tax=Chiloscyllium punctatum TaxID=137246 RepID=A0A401SXN8_CHIPU|nr:hypothetical protein [Chiloscyllium punctatum]
MALTSGSLCVLGSLLFLSTFQWRLTEGGELLVVPVDGSHWLNLKTLMDELGRRGHNVVVVIPEINLKMGPSPHYTTRVFPVPYSKDELYSLKPDVCTNMSLIERLRTGFEKTSSLRQLLMKTCESLLYNKELMQELVERKFDALLTDPFVPCGAIIAEYLSLPTINLLRGLPCGLDSLATQCPRPLSYVPRIFTRNTDRMTFLQRTKNVLEFEEFVNSSGEHGIVIFSFGSMVSEVPREIANRIAAALGRIPQKVLWRYTGDPPETLAPNTKLLEWLPQNDLLGHPKARAFLTHGGMNGLYEAICSGVPSVMIPLFGDQGYNVVQMVNRGAGVELDIEQMSSDDLVNALNMVINDTRYREAMMTLSSLHKDHSLHPLDLSVHWVEFVMRHKGAGHLRPAAHELNWIQYHSLDVIGVLLVTVLLSVWMLAKCCWYCCRRCFCGTRSQRKRKPD